MIINKITTGFVVQQFDTKQNKWIHQEFIASDDCEIEYADMSQEDVDDGVDPADVLGDINPSDLNLDMVQPHELEKKRSEDNGIGGINDVAHRV